MLKYVFYCSFCLQSKVNLIGPEHGMENTPNIEQRLQFPQDTENLPLRFVGLFVCGNFYSQPEAAVTYPLYHIIHYEFFLRIQLCLGGKRLTFKTIKDFI